MLAAGIVVATVGCSASSESVDDGATEVSSKSAHFETFVGVDGRTYFDLVAANGQNVLRSQGYTSATSAKTGIASVVENAVDPSAYQLLEATDGTWYFNLTAANHEVIGTSEMYVSKSNATRGASTVRALANLLGQSPSVLKATKQARFEVFTGEDKKFYFHLRAGNGEVVLGSQGYTAKASALSGIASVQTNGVEDARWSTPAAVDGEYGIRLVAGNGAIIGSGELYTSASDAQRAVGTIESLLAEKLPIEQ
ncbi:MAG TPA: YegP family protein [Polyangiaceae bacterium]